MPDFDTSEPNRRARSYRRVTGEEPEPTPPPAQSGASARPPCKPPLELIETDGEWVVREYRRTQDAASVFSTHDRRIDAMRAAKDRMERSRHPCLLRWDAPDIVGDIYWNELFECLRVTRSAMLNAWVVVPERDTVVFDVSSDLEAACERAKTIQRAFDFKRLELRSTDGQTKQSIDHRFVRHGIAESGVRYRRDKLSTPPAESAPDDDTDADRPAQPDIGSMTTASTLMAAIPDVTELDPIDTSGYVHRYRGAWTDGEVAHIVLLDPDRGEKGSAVKRFMSAVEDWQSVSQRESVSTIYEVGVSPSAWVAYRAGNGSAEHYCSSLSLDARLQVLDDVAAAVSAAARNDAYPTAVRPDSVRVRSRDDRVRAALAGWGIERAVAGAFGDTSVTPYTAPEQLAGTIERTTPVYQLGAVAYRLLCERKPFAETRDLRGAIRDGSVRNPSSGTDLPGRVDTVLRRAMAPEPTQRYDSARTLSTRLSEVLA